MTLRLCPDCENFHRGRAVVCRPCAQERLRRHKLWLVSRETDDAEKLAADVLAEFLGANG